VLEEPFPEENLFAAATTLVTIGGGGCVIAQETTSDKSSGFVGSRISLWERLGRRRAELSATFNPFSSRPLPPNGTLENVGVVVDVVEDKVEMKFSEDDAEDEVIGISKFVNKAVLARSGSTRVIKKVILNEIEFNSELSS
jgi:hypothetical protein